MDQTNVKIILDESKQTEPSYTVINLEQKRLFSDVFSTLELFNSDITSSLEPKSLE
jgi:hypothetical protein